MEFTYIYRTSAGARLEATITAESRDDAFKALRAQGIRPIKVIARDGTKANGAPAVRRRWPLVVLLAAVAAGISLSFLAGRKTSAPVQVSLDGTTITTTVAQPLERQRIPGDRLRIEQALEKFAFRTEAVLARFAEPGRAVSLPQEDVTDQRDCLKTPLKVASDELSESIDLKRIVTGMKRELQAYLAAGGTWDEYVAELAKRQKLEISYRESAEKKVLDTLGAATPDLAKAYDIWLKANAQLESMGIYPIALPDALRDYQLGLGFED